MELNKLKSIDPKKMQGNIFELIGDKWFLLTAAKKDGSYNTMTASWGGMGIMWGKPVTWTVVRPVRYTYEFMEEADYFMLTFFPEEYRKALNILGTKSGRDCDKIKESGLTPAVISGLSESSGLLVSFEEAELIIACKKIYYQDVDPARFIETEIDKNYPKKDYHRMYFGEITDCLAKI